MNVRPVILSAAALTAVSGVVPIAQASVMSATPSGRTAAPAMAVSRAEPPDQCQTWRTGAFVHTVCYRNDPAVAKAQVSDHGRPVGGCVLTPRSPTCRIRDSRYDVALAEFQAHFADGRVSESLTFCVLNACSTKQHVFKFRQPAHARR